MKKYLMMAAAALCLTGALAAQDAAKPKMEIRFQPYLELYWLPVAGDPVGGLTSVNYRALTFNQAGLKTTGTFEKAQLYVETRGVPSSVYNESDTNYAMINNWKSVPVYYAWGKYQFTDTGNLWIGKFKPTFGPILVDASITGAGWQQKLSPSLGLNIYAMQPSAGYGAGNGVLNAGLLKSGDSDEGFGGLITVDFLSKTAMISGGVAYNQLDDDNSALLFDVMASYRGVPKLSLTADILAANASGAEDSSFGLGVYLSAEYSVTPVIIPGISVKYTSPELGGDKVTWQSSVSAPSYETTSGYVQVDGSAYSTDIGLWCKIQPQRSFYIQPGITIKAANALNDPPDGYDAVVYDFKLSFRWEPSFSVGL